MAIQPRKQWYGAEARRARYLQFRAQMRAQGYDPNIIGAQEVKPVCCPGCGHAIPWELVKGWRD